MDACISVKNPTQDKEIALFRFSYSHVGCDGGASMEWSRDPVNDICTIKCGCGLSISFPQHEAATRSIAYASIDGQAHELPSDSFTSPQATTVTVVGRSGV
jgi:hypothetical protein